ncbi:ABC transporter substrate-binding protein [Bacillus massilinigeriensis]|uniref:ABC transporter substrate-binding protein n=1 Tax=Bacillus mediterraneensis TaxID=1805474 RepID=UPI0008F7FB10|nr:ABC transporter substrate-binding protein [Bacillus mediterraneensis]
MKKFYPLLITMLFITVFIISGCSGNSAGEKENKQAKGNESFPVTIVDGVNKKVTIESKPQKIVSLIPSNTEIAFSLGLNKQIVGVSNFDNYPEEVKKKTKIGERDFNVEKIVSLKPDLVLAHASGAHNAKEGLNQLRDAGITVLIVNEAENFDTVYESIEMIGKATGTYNKAKKITADMKDRLQEIEKKAQSIDKSEVKKVFIEVSPAPNIVAAGKKTFIDDMLGLIQAKNAVEANGWPKIDPEAVIESNPDTIITTYGYDTSDPIKNVTSRSGWQDINAVKNKAVADVHSDKVARPGPRLVEGVEELAKAVYPEVFK